MQFSTPPAFRIVCERENPSAQPHFHCVAPDVANGLFIEARLPSRDGFSGEESERAAYKHDEAARRACVFRVFLAISYMCVYEARRHSPHGHRPRRLVGWYYFCACIKLHAAQQTRLDGFKEGLMLFLLPKEAAVSLRSVGAEFIAARLRPRRAYIHGVLTCAKSTQAERKLAHFCFEMPLARMYIFCGAKFARAKV